MSLDEILKSRSFVKASEDLELLQRDELRPVRLQLELIKPELVQQEQGVASTIVVFGSARLPETSPYYAQAREFARIVSSTCAKKGPSGG